MFFLQFLFVFVFVSTGKIENSPPGSIFPDQISLSTWSHHLRIKLNKENNGESLKKPVDRWIFRCPLFGHCLILYFHNFTIHKMSGKVEFQSHASLRYWFLLHSCMDVTSGWQFLSLPSFRWHLMIFTALQCLLFQKICFTRISFIYWSAFWK